MKNNIFLREMEHKDLKDVLLWRNRSEVRTNMYNRHVILWDEHNAWFESSREDKTKKNMLAFYDGICLGVVYFSEINYISQNCFWGFYSSGNPFFRAGIVMEYLALYHVFESLNFEKLNCEVLAFNQKIISFHRKCGFLQEGLFRRVYFDGKSYHDIVRMGMIRSEWQNNKQKLRRLSGLHNN